MRSYENLSHISENREKQRSYYIPENSYIGLNGIWDFKYYEYDYDEDSTENEWIKTEVPSCWQLKGFDSPNYSNQAYPYSFDPPYVPDKNPMGIYKRQFEIEDTDRKIYITLYFFQIIDYYFHCCPGGGMVDTRDLKSLAFTGVRVRVSFWAI